LAEVLPMIPLCRTTAVVAMLATIACARAAKPQSGVSKFRWLAVKVGLQSTSGRST
jgi:hypothetical protein